MVAKNRVRRVLEFRRKLIKLAPPQNGALLPRHDMFDSLCESRQDSCGGVVCCSNCCSLERVWKYVGSSGKFELETESLCCVHQSRTNLYRLTHRTGKVPGEDAPISPARRWWRVLGHGFWHWQGGGGGRVALPEPGGVPWHWNSGRPRPWGKGACLAPQGCDRRRPSLVGEPEAVRIARVVCCRMLLVFLRWLLWTSGPWRHEQGVHLCARIYDRYPRQALSCLSPVGLSFVCCCVETRRVVCGLDGLRKRICLVSGTLRRNLGIHRSIGLGFSRKERNTRTDPRSMKTPPSRLHPQKLSILTEVVHLPCAGPSVAPPSPAYPSFLYNPRSLPSLESHVADAGACAPESPAGALFSCCGRCTRESTTHWSGRRRRSSSSRGSSWTRRVTFRWGPLLSYSARPCVSSPFEAWARPVCCWPWMCCWRRPCSCAGRCLGVQPVACVLLIMCLFPSPMLLSSRNLQTKSLERSRSFQPWYEPCELKRCDEVSRLQE